MTSLLTIDKIFKCLSSLPLSIQESLWWWQCSIMYSFPLSLPTGISVPGQYVLGDNSLINKEPNLYQILSFRGCAYQHTFCLWCSVLPPPPQPPPPPPFKRYFLLFVFVQWYNYWLCTGACDIQFCGVVLMAVSDLVTQGLVACCFGGLLWWPHDTGACDMFFWGVILIASSHRGLWLRVLRLMERNACDGQAYILVSGKHSSKDCVCCVVV